MQRACEREEDVDQIRSRFIALIRTTLNLDNGPRNSEKPLGVLGLEAPGINKP